MLNQASARLHFLASFGLSDGLWGLTMGAMWDEKNKKCGSAKNKTSLGRLVWLGVIKLFFVYYFIYSSMSRLMQIF